MSEPLDKRRQAKQNTAHNRDTDLDQRFEDSVHESWHRVSDVVKCSTSKNVGQLCIGIAATREVKRSCAELLAQHARDGPRHSPCTWR